MAMLIHAYGKKTACVCVSKMLMSQGFDSGVWHAFESKTLITHQEKEKRKQGQHL